MHKPLLPALALLALLGGTSSPARADSYFISNSCTAPWDRSGESADRYRECIVDFVNEQRAAAKRHAEAANDAIDQWNSFAKGW